MLTVAHPKNFSEFFMPSVEQETICQMFDRIASTYDSVNRVLSCGQDIRWRQIVAELLPSTPDISVLDIATGTADLLLTMCKRRPNIKAAYGIDLAENMLSVGQRKVVRLGLENRITLQKADACALPFADASIDVAAIAFGIRNVTNIDLALGEIARVLKPSGLALILEFSLPENLLIRKLYLFYFRHVLPFMGGLISKEKNAYRYLNQTVEAFPSCLAFSQMLLNNGFKSVSNQALTFGIATVYCARKS